MDLTGSVVNSSRSKARASSPSSTISKSASWANLTGPVWPFSATTTDNGISPVSTDGATSARQPIGTKPAAPLTHSHTNAAQRGPASASWKSSRKPLSWRPDSRYVSTAPLSVSSRTRSGPALRSKSNRTDSWIESCRSSNSISIFFTPPCEGRFDDQSSSSSSRRIRLRFPPSPPTRIDSPRNFARPIRQRP